MTTMHPSRGLASLPNRSAPTLDDVARRAGVSTATVSRCLNTPDRVVEKTRVRVMQAVQELGYTPNFGARVMAARRTNTIGAVIPTMENAIFARGLQAFQEELHARGYMLLVASSSYRLDREEEQIRALISRGADGLMLIGHERQAELLEFIEAQNVPSLATWSYAPDTVLPSIGFDNRTAMRAMADKVIAFGHTRIGVISGITRGNDRARMRLRGVYDAVSAAGMEPSELPVVETSYAIDAGGTAFASLMDRPDPPTAVICGNDVLAVGAMVEARQRGLRIPDDVSITGFDDIELAQVVDPGLTTVHVPHREMGRRAAIALVGMVRDGVRCVPEELATHLTMRGSLAEPPVR